MEVGEVRHFPTRAALRRWLERNHATATELWCGIYKQASGKRGPRYEEVRDEALCFGWVDGFTKSIDTDAYVVRLTPRRAKSSWSAINIARIAELTAEGRMHPAGLAAFERRPRT